MEDMPGDFMKNYAKHFGIEKSVQLMGMFGGEYLYIPLLDAVKEKKRIRKARKQIIEEFKKFKNEISITQLSKKYGVSRAMVHNILIKIKKGCG